MLSHELVVESLLKYNFPQDGVMEMCVGRTTGRAVLLELDIWGKRDGGGSPGVATGVGVHSLSS